jgi:hypothetical protein
MTVQAFRCLSCGRILLDEEQMARHIEAEHPMEPEEGK